MVFLAFAEIYLVPDGTMLIHIALILLMIWVLNRTFFRPINRVLEAREKHKGGRFGEAEVILRQVGEKQTRYDAALLEARSKGYELIEKKRNQAVAARQSEIEKVKSEIANNVAHEKEEMVRQTAEARAAIAKEAEQMAEKISSNLLKTA
ncbi:MAG: ATP synthase F0 subunit B [Acidobacteriota bacterium]|nr:ATP synthase F0 subunit B [Acidobacteriota bacterium]